MNKRGQIYVLAAIILSIAIFSVTKVTNQAIAPSEDNFDFFVENFEGERAYVANLGHLQQDDNSYFLRGKGNDPSLLETFQDFGINTGVVLVEHDNEGWGVANYLGEGNIVQVDDCDNSGQGNSDDECESVGVISSEEGAHEFNIELGNGGRKFRAGGGNVGEFGEGFFRQTFPDTGGEFIVTVDGNNYRFDRPSDEDSVESLLFRNIGENYVKIYKV
tara:strand:+ start:187 stop:840 length:654 start_codon:yes stop_codon:yes gene_type:complete